MHFATLLQYVFPMIFLVATVVSFVRRWRSIALFDDIRVDPTASIAVLSWQDFETLVGDGFRKERMSDPISDAIRRVQRTQ